MYSAARPKTFKINLMDHMCSVCCEVKLKYVCLLPSSRTMGIRDAVGARLFVLGFFLIPRYLKLKTLSLISAPKSFPCEVK